MEAPFKLHASYIISQLLGSRRASERRPVQKGKSVSSTLLRDTWKISEQLGLPREAGEFAFEWREKRAGDGILLAHGVAPTGENLCWIAEIS
jgi:hypothetical protein